MFPRWSIYPGHALRPVLLALWLIGILAIPGLSPADAATLPACNAVSTPKDLHVTTSSGLATVEQGYRCLLRHYISGKTLDDRVLLRGAYKELADTVGQQVLSRTGGTLAPLTGDREADWRAFSRVFARLSASLFDLGVAQQALAQICLEGMATSLHDDHTGYLPAQFMKPQLALLSDSGPVPSLGLVYTPVTASTAATLFVTDVFPDGPAAQGGVRPGDIITAIGGQAPFANGQPTAALLPLLLPQIGSTVSLTLQRPATATTLTVSLMPRALVPPETSARVLPGHIGYVKLYAFTAHAADRVFGALKALHLGAGMRGVVLDLRGNLGGDASQPVRIISAFVHHRILAYQTDGRGKRDPQRTDDRVPLLHLPLAVLIDGDSSSSSEIIAGAVRDLHLGRLIGARSAGALAGAEFFGLSDGSGLEITEVRITGPKGERIDGIGVAPDEQVPRTAAELSAGRDPAVDRAVQYLQTAQPAT